MLKTGQRPVYQGIAFSPNYASAHTHLTVKQGECCNNLHPRHNNVQMLRLCLGILLTIAYVVCSFWNFDALFQPQQHPARDAHDTFFLTSKSVRNLVPS